jgi:hypothetical protein
LRICAEEYLPPDPDFTGTLSLFFCTHCIPLSDDNLQIYLISGTSYVRNGLLQARFDDLNGLLIKCLLLDSIFESLKKQFANCLR